MKRMARTNILGVHLVEGAGRWVQQEQPEEASKLLIRFLQRARSDGQRSLLSGRDLARFLRLVQIREVLPAPSPILVDTCGWLKCVYG